MTAAADIDFAPARPAGGVLAPLVWAHLGGAGVGLAAGIAGQGLLVSLLLAWLAAIALTVAVPAAMLLLLRDAGAGVEAELAAWDADLAEERAVASRRTDRAA